MCEWCVTYIFYEMINHKCLQHLTLGNNTCEIIICLILRTCYSAVLHHPVIFMIPPTDRVCHRIKAIHSVDSRLLPSQWEMSLQSDPVSHWLGTNLESALHPYPRAAYSMHIVSMKFCTCHNSSAVVACAKFDWFIAIGVLTSNYLWYPKNALGLFLVKLVSSPPGPRWRSHSRW